MVLLLRAARLLVALGLLLLAPGLAAPARAAPGSAWSWPLEPPPAVVRAYAPGPTPWSAGHRGADLAGTPGQPVLAAGAGVVSYAGLLAGRGVVVVVHGGLRTTYEPVRAAVVVGTRVGGGQVLGTLDAGHAGCAAAACLHWGLLRGRDHLDPVLLLGGGPVRLLPVGSAAGDSASGSSKAGDSAAPAVSTALPGPPPAAESRPRHDHGLPVAATAGAVVTGAALVGVARRRPPPRRGLP